ncbi:MAG: hypothetical protein JOS17DRAFT_805085 [Linnemannia elongata]|nr:MAG: hypothetical protein JOS17DRAFT_805085 [Linnemannia elongata]
MADPSLDDITSTSPPPTLTPSYSAMGRALDIPEISYLIRQDLQGFHLKSAVLICKLWWRLFAPYLWERVFIDAELDEKDREVLVRNGLAARSLTLSIYDPEDREGIVEYVVDRCRNVEALHLKLFSPELVVVDEEAMERRLRKPCENGGAGGKDADQERQFGIRSECKTDLLDSLLSKLPYVSELTLSIAQEDLKPEVLWCVPVLTRLRKLTIAGGLPGNGYIVHKNRQCDWDLILRSSRECQYLNSLSVSWESNNPRDVNHDADHQASSALPTSEQFPSLRALNLAHCEPPGSSMGLFYRSCPNLRAVEFKAIDTSSLVVEKNLKVLAQSCPNLVSFKFLDASRKNDKIDYSTSLLAGSSTGLHSLTLSITAHNSRTVFGNDPAADRDYTKWLPPASITSLSIRDVRYPQVLLDTITSTPAGLTHLTIDGYIGNSYALRYATFHTFTDNSFSTIDGMYEIEKNPLLRMPTFGCLDTLVYLDVSTLDIVDSRKLFKIVYRRVQDLRVLRFLKMARAHVLAANLELSWSDDTLAREDDQLEATISTTTTEPTLETEEEEVLQDWEPSDDQDCEKVFIWFPTVEHLYLVDTEYRRYHDLNPFLTQHQASALVKMMPRLKAMSFNREDAKAGLEGIIAACPKVSFNFTMRQK